MSKVSLATATQTLSDNLQHKLPLAVVAGQPQFELPEDLYIPPDALEVFLEAFEGPLDLLLYLIRKQNLDILDIPIARITEQYMEYIELMREMRFELAAEYLLMAAMLAEIKSRMLLPRPQQSEDEEQDPRAELIRRLQEYERFKQAAEDLGELPRIGRDVFQAQAKTPDIRHQRPQPDVELRQLLLALRDVLRRADLFSKHQISREPLSLRERMSRVLEAVEPGTPVAFHQLFDLCEGRDGVVVTFMAILELLKQRLIEMTQNGNFAPIQLRSRGESV